MPSRTFDATEASTQLYLYSYHNRNADLLRNFGIEAGSSHSSLLNALRLYHQAIGLSQGARRGGLRSGQEIDCFVLCFGFLVVENFAEAECLAWVCTAMIFPPL